MNPDEIDRSLATDAPVEPSPWFTARVMRAVRAEVAGRQRSAIPWSRLWPGIAAAATVVPAVLAGSLLESVSPGTALGQAGQWLSLGLAAMLVAAWWCTGLVRR